ncbi:4Fe-4S binding protein [Candidatus Bipolaricaulota bacterium]|nr:4Fe-4S binding protein [Candidatus Bipolaricaulota bacterium]
MSLPEKFAEWKGIPREEIDWNPTIDKDKCVGCGMCVSSCGRNVFDYDPNEGKADVARPLQCMVGCTSCETWCINEAIGFPEPGYVKELIKEENVLAKIDKENLS